MILLNSAHAKFLFNNLELTLPLLRLEGRKSLLRRDGAAYSEYRNNYLSHNNGQYPQNYRPTADTIDARRSRRSSANRILTILKATLNVA